MLREEILQHPLSQKIVGGGHVVPDFPVDGHILYVYIRRKKLS